MHQKEKQVSSMAHIHENLGRFSKNELLLDVRTPEEFAESHVPGAKNIDHTKVLNHVEELRAYDHVYIYCRVGGRAQVAMAMLQSVGLTNLVCIAKTGMRDWLAAGYPVER